MKYVPGLLAGQLSRSQGNTTASHNRFGSYFRNRVTPVNPRTALQTLQRNALGGLSSDFRTLTAVQRLGWANLGAQVPRVDSLGQTFFMTGLQMFTSLGRNAISTGSSPLSNAPALETPSTLLSITPVATSSLGGTFTVAWTPTPLGTSEKIVVEATGPISPGRNFVPRSSFRQVFVGAAASTSPADIKAAWVAKFGALSSSIGMKVFVRIKVVTGNFFAGPPLESSVVIS